MSKHSRDLPGSESGDPSVGNEQPQQEVRGTPGVMTPGEVEAARVRIGKMRILDAAGLAEARRNARGVVASEQEGEKGWDGRSRAEIMAIRDKYRLGDFNAAYDIGIAKLAQEQLTNLEKVRDRLRAQGVQSGSEWKSMMEETERYQNMLEATPPEARPTQAEFDLERQTKEAWRAYQRASTKNETVGGVARFLEVFTGPKPESGEIKTARAAWKLEKSREDQVAAEKILRLAAAMDLPSNDREDVQVGQMLGEWRVAYVTKSKEISAGSKVILQKGEGSDRTFVIKSADQMKRIAKREKFLVDHPGDRNRTADDDLS